MDNSDPHIRTTIAVLLLLFWSATAKAQTTLDGCRHHVLYGAPSTDDVLLCRIGYALSHDGAGKVPRWVAYAVKEEQLGGPIKRTNNFHADPDLPEAHRSGPNDFGDSDFHRGHMAPAGLFTTNLEAMEQSFLMSNMAPQAASLNTGAWKGLENRVRKWARERGKLYVVSGPVFGPIPGEDLGNLPVDFNGVRVPTGFYKVIFDPVRVVAIAFILPNRRVLTEALLDHIRSVREIEEATGLDFHHQLQDEVEEVVEARVPTSLW